MIYAAFLFLAGKKMTGSQQKGKIIGGYTSGREANFLPDL
jgi:hypothetical protein